MQHARDRIRFLTMRARLAAPVEEVVGDINLFLRGWAGYFRYGNSAHTFDKIRNYALMRLAPAQRRVSLRRCPSLWVPETPDTSGDLLILMEQSTEPVPPSDASLVVGRRRGSSPARSGLFRTGPAARCRVP
jgi:hypothetical protein